MKPNIIYNKRYRTIIARLIKARKDAGFTQEQLSAKLGLRQPEVSRIESLQRQLDVIELLDWIRVTEASGLSGISKALEADNA